MVHPEGAPRLISVPDDDKSTPQKRADHPVTTLRASTAQSGSRCWPATTRPSSSRRVNLVRSGRTKVASGTSRSFRWVIVEHCRDLIIGMGDVFCRGAMRGAGFGG